MGRQVIPMILRGATRVTLAILVMGATGCLSLATESSHKRRVEDAKIEHYYTFYRDQAEKISAQVGCFEGAGYFNTSMLTRGSGGQRHAVGGALSNHVPRDRRDELMPRITQDAVALKDRCLQAQVPAMIQDKQFKELSTLFTRLAELPLPQPQLAELEQRAATTELLRARAVADEAQALWDQGKFAQALNAFSSAKSIAAAVKAAPEPERLAFAQLHQQRLDAHVQDLLRQAAQEERSPQTLHLALARVARAHQLKPSPATFDKLRALREALLAAHRYLIQVELTGDATITQAAREVLARHAWPGNIRPQAPRELAMRLVVSPPQISPSERDGQRTGQVKSGTRLVMNPAYKKALREVEDRELCMTKNEGTCKWGRGTCKWCGGNAYQSNRKVLQEAQAELRRIPQQIEQDDYRDVRYATREHRWELKAPVSMTLKTSAQASPGSSSFVQTFVYEDHAHGPVPELNLGARAVRPPTPAQLAASAGQRLAQDAIKLIEGDYAKWLEALPAQGDRGVILSMILHGQGGKLDRQLEERLGYPNASAALRATR